MIERDKAYYLSIPYLWDFEARQEGNDGYFIAYLRDIPQVRADGATRDEARLRLSVAFDDYLDWRLECKLPIPQTSTPYVDGSLGVESPRRMPALPVVSDTVNRDTTDPWTTASQLPSQTEALETLAMAGGG